MINKDLLKARAADIGINLDTEALDRFDKYAELLVYWNERINLTAITDPEGIVEKHFIDCLAFLKYNPLKGSEKVIDVGTGAGFPGIVLLIMYPDLKMTLLDSTEKKLNVIKDILEKLGLSAEVVHMRAEDAGQDDRFREEFDLATARAVSNLRDLSEYCLPFVKIGGSFISMKGAGAKEEWEIGENAVKTLGGELKSFDSYELPGCGERAIINILKKSNTPPKYPRPKGQMQKKPL